MGVRILSDGNQWEVIFQHLENGGVEVYPPGVKTGECTSPYVVLKHGDVSRRAGRSMEQAEYDLLLHIPKEEYGELEGFLQKIRAIMKGLSPLIKPARYENRNENRVDLICTYDYNANARVHCIRYVNYRDFC